MAIKDIFEIEFDDELFEELNTTETEDEDDFEEKEILRQTLHGALQADGESQRTEISDSIIEVVPSLPNYQIERCEVTRVLKYLLKPNDFLYKKAVIEYPFGGCYIVDLMIKNANFSCLPLAPNTMPAHNVVGLFVHCDFDIEYTRRKLALWGINKVYINANPNKTASILDLLKGLDASLSAETISQTIILCDDGENAVEKYMFRDFPEDRILEAYKIARKIQMV